MEKLSEPTFQAPTRVDGRGLIRFIARPLVWFAGFGSVAYLVLFTIPFSMAGVAAVRVLGMGGALTAVLVLAHLVAGVSLPRVFGTAPAPSRVVRWIETALAAHGALLIAAWMNPFEELKPLPDRALFVLACSSAAAVLGTTVAIASRLRAFVRRRSAATSGQIAR